MANKRRMVTSKYYKRWTWTRQITQCENHPEYPSYGGRGIELHFSDYWEYEAYIDKKLGPQPSADYQLGRIDKTKHFAPGNLVWQLPIERSNSNTRQNIKAKYKNRSQTLANWSRELGIPFWTLRRRIARGIPIKDIIKDFQ